MRKYSTLSDGSWEKKRCNTFNVASTRVKMPKHIATRITTVLKRMPKEKTLGDLVDEGHTNWCGRYPDFGQTMRVYLMAAINDAAGKTVLIKSGPRSKALPTPPVAAPTPEAQSMPNDHFRHEMIKKLADKFKVVEAPMDQQSEFVLVEPSDGEMLGNFAYMNPAQLRVKCVAQAKMLWKINKENQELRQQLAAIRDKIDKVFAS